MMAGTSLPVGMTCGHCVHIGRCEAMFGHVEADTYCDWAPSRFRLASAIEAASAGSTKGESAVGDSRDAQPDAASEDSSSSTTGTVVEADAHSSTRDPEGANNSPGSDR